MKKKLTRLRLKRETVRSLGRDLQFVAGGTVTYENLSGCGICSNGGCGGVGTGGNTGPGGNIGTDGGGNGHCGGDGGTSGIDCNFATC